MTQVVWGHPDYGGEEAAGLGLELGLGVRSSSLIAILGFRCYRLAGGGFRAGMVHVGMKMLADALVQTDASRGPWSP